MDIDFDKALQHLIDIGVTGYELHKYSGQSQTGLRRVLTKKILNPRRKTRNIIIDYYKEITNKEDSVDTDENVFFTEKNINIIRDAILLYEDKLLEDKVFKQWLENKLLMRENEVLKKTK